MNTDNNASGKQGSKAGDKNGAEQQGDTQVKAPALIESSVGDETLHKGQSTQQAAKQTPKNSNQRKRSSVSWLFVLLVFGTVAAGGYYGWPYVKPYLFAQKDNEQNTAALWQQRIDEQNEKIAALERRLQQQGELQDRLSAQQGLFASQEQLAGYEQQLAKLQRQVTSQGSRLRALSTTTREDWLLAEAEYLLRLANQRLLTERTTENPVALLQTVDKILKDFDDPSLFAVRKQIAADITALKLVGKLDREGLYLQLDSLIDVVPQLTLLVTPWQEGQPEIGVTDNPSAAEDEPSWGGRLWVNAKRALGGMSDYFRIRRLDRPSEPLLGAQQEVYLRQNLRLMLEQAQLALLHGEQTVYQTSLRKSSEWLNTYFQHNQRSQVLVEQLQVLSDQSVELQLPDITASLNALRNYINLWHLRHEGSPSTAEGASQ